MNRPTLRHLSFLCAGLTAGAHANAAPELQLVELVDGQVWDLSGPRVLYDGGFRALKLRDRATGQDVTINQAARSPLRGFLAPRGAIWVQDDGVSASGDLFEWRDGVLSQLDEDLFSNPSLTVDGGFAIWSSLDSGTGLSLFRRDLNAGTTVTVINGSVGNWNNDVAPKGDVAPNGDVAFWSGNNIHRYRNGQTTQLTHDTELFNYYPRTDGVNVVFTKSEAGLGARGISMVNASGAEVPLVPLTPGATTFPDGDYRANGGWVAYVKDAVGPVAEFHRISPAGVADVIGLPGFAELKTLAPDGAMSIRWDNQGTVIFDPALGPGFTNVGDVNARTFWADGAWYVVRGGDQVNPGGIVEEVITSSVPGAWLSATGGNWTDAANWSTSPQFPHHAPGGPGYDVTIGATGGPYTIQSAVPITLMSLNVTAAGARVEFAPDARLTIGTRGLRLTPGTGLVAHVASAGDVTIDAATFTGNMRLTPGRKLTLSNAAVATFTASADSLRVGQLELSQASHVEIAPGTRRLLHTSSLVIDAQSSIDLADGVLFIETGGATTLNAVRAWVLSGRNGGAWDGPGIHSSVAAVTAATHGVGFAPGGGASARYTRYGDATLDGLVNLSDFNRLAANFGRTNRIWFDGDFNYDGFINLLDFNRLAANFGLSASGGDVSPADWAALAAAVPEPGAAVAGVLSLAPSLIRRRRQQTLTV